MTQPSVCAIMLVNGRADMCARALRCFEAQTYPSADLLIYDTSEQSLAFNPPRGARWTVAIPKTHGETIGALRNEANELAVSADIIMHWDSDDWSHPRRIEEQVALLQASGKECVGYRDMLFWETYPGCPTCAKTLGVHRDPSDCPHARAWLYTNANPKYCLGTSLCYWRRVWQRHPFADLPKGPTGAGEDTQWLRGVDSLGVACVAAQDDPNSDDPMDQPRMIASVYGGNTTSIAALGIKHGRAPEWRRAAEFDAYCRGAMKL